MKTLFVLATTICLCGTTSAFSQTDTNTTSYKAKAFGSVATGAYTPFWMVSNQYGIVPLDANNGFFNAGVFHNQHFGKGFRWSAGLDLVAAAPRYHNVYIQQLYAEVGYKCLQLSVGSKENKHSLWDLNLSTGDMVQSINSRPIPEVNISIPEFTTIPLTKGWLQFKGDFAVGKSFDSKYLKHVTNGNQIYVDDVLWHHKSLYFQIKNTQNDSPFSAIVGVQHWAQWGGTSTNPSIGKQPHSLKDLFRIVVGSGGGSDATLADQINVLGNHYGSYDFKLTYNKSDWAISAYHQHYFDDNSGMVFVNWTDGLWGIEGEIKSFPWIRKIVTEYFSTMNQSGPFHFIDFDHDQYKGPGGGNDNYYNNGEYITGVSYFGRGIGSPLIPAPEYNGNGTLQFTNNRVRAWHLAFEGEVSKQVLYRLKYTTMNSFGTHSSPLLKNKRSNSAVLEIKYQHPKLAGWEFGGSVAGDFGALYGDNFGLGLTICKKGIIKAW